MDAFKKIANVWATAQLKKESLKLIPENYNEVLLFGMFGFKYKGSSVKKLSIQELYHIKNNNSEL